MKPEQLLIFSAIAFVILIAPACPDVWICIRWQTPFFITRLSWPSFIQILDVWSWGWCDKVNWEPSNARWLSRINLRYTKPSYALTLYLRGDSTEQRPDLSISKFRGRRWMATSSQNPLCLDIFQMDTLGYWCLDVHAKPLTAPVQLHAWNNFLMFNITSRPRQNLCKRGTCAECSLSVRVQNPTSRNSKLAGWRCASVLLTVRPQSWRHLSLDLVVNVLLLTELLNYCCL